MNLRSLTERFYMGAAAQLNGVKYNGPESHNPFNPGVIKAVKEHFGSEYASKLHGVRPEKLVELASTLSNASVQVNQSISEETSMLREKCLKVAAVGILTIAALYVGVNNSHVLSLLNPFRYF